MEFQSHNCLIISYSHHPIRFSLNNRLCELLDEAKVDMTINVSRQGDLVG